jgi:hypothetical protein
MIEFERVFSAASQLAILGWLLLIFLPRWWWTTTFITSWLIPAILAVAYLVLIVMYFRAAPANATFDSLAGVRAFFELDGLLLAGWIHYLCFDLFIGSWEVRDARRQGIHHLLVIPCLVFTFLLGPIGLLAYLLLKYALRGRWTIDETQAPVVVSP